MNGTKEYINHCNEYFRSLEGFLLIPNYRRGSRVYNFFTSMTGDTIYVNVIILYEVYLEQFNKTDDSVKLFWEYLRDILNDNNFINEPRDFSLKDKIVISCNQLTDKFKPFRKYYLQYSEPQNEFIIEDNNK